jgi:hypothetical protein
MNTSFSNHVGGMWVDLFSRPGFAGRHTRLMGPAHFDDLPSSVGSIVVGHACELCVITRAGITLHIDAGTRMGDLTSMPGGGVARLEVNHPSQPMRQAA